MADVAAQLKNVYQVRQCNVIISWPHPIAVTIAGGLCLEGLRIGAALTLLAPGSK